MAQPCGECGRPRASNFRLAVPCPDCRQVEGEIVAVVIGEAGSVERRINRQQAEAINRGAIAAPNLFLSLAPESQRILVRVFEKPVARPSPGDP